VAASRSGCIEKLLARIVITLLKSMTRNWIFNGV